MAVKDSRLDDKIWNTVPSTKIYRRTKPEERGLEKKEDKMSNLYDNKRDKDRDHALAKKYEEILNIHLRQENPNKVNFEKMF